MREAVRSTPHRARAVAFVFLVYSLSLAATTFPSPAEASHTDAPSDEEHVDVPVEFDVWNSNRSALPCVSDNRPYVVRGRLEGPRSAIVRENRSATLYLHSPVLAGHAEWRLDDVDGYDYAHQQALAGHVSITIDRLGYGESDIPSGDASCYGAAADVAHQIVGSLRTGDYRSPYAVPFDRVAIAGFSGGGLVAQVEAYSFGDVDALIVIGWADSGHAPGFAAAAGPDVIPCGTGGYEKRPGAATGYVHLFSGEQAFAQWLFSDTDREVLEAARRYREADPCGELGSIPQALVANNVHLGEITVPVLLVYGAQDRIYEPSARDTHLARFTGSDDVTLVNVGSAGHTVMLELGAPQFRSDASAWLRLRGF